MVEAPARTAGRSRARLSFIGIVLLFVVPLILAAGLYFGGWRPLGRVNNGELLDPPRDLSGLVVAASGSGQSPASTLLAGQWSLVHVVDVDCGPQCQDALVETRQVRTALGKDADRVLRVLFTQGAPLSDLGAELQREHPDLVTARLASTATWLRSDSVWLADPLGNLILRYPPGYASRGLLKDLKRLLKLSKIG